MKADPCAGLHRLSAALALGTVSVSAQSPSPFDGDYEGTATLVWTDTDCATIPRVAMRIRGGQVAIRENLASGPRPLYTGTVSASGAVHATHTSAMPTTDQGRGGIFVIDGTIRDNVVTGDRVMGRGCHFSIQMSKTASQ